MTAYLLRIESLVRHTVRVYCPQRDCRASWVLNREVSRALAGLPASCRGCGRVHLYPHELPEGLSDRQAA